MIIAQSSLSQVIICKNTEFAGIFIWPYSLSGWIGNISQIAELELELAKHSKAKLISVLFLISTILNQLRTHPLSCLSLLITSLVQLTKREREEREDECKSLVNPYKWLTRETSVTGQKKTTCMMIKDDVRT